MKANELRIGNVIYDQMFGVCVVVDITKDGINIINGTCAISIDELKGIELTEKILKDLGFSKMTDTIPFNYRTHKSKSFFYIRYGTFTTDRGKSDLIGYNGLFVANKFALVIRYVHELQNLYFALTGEELTLKSE